MIDTCDLTPGGGVLRWNWLRYFWKEPDFPHGAAVTSITLSFLVTSVTPSFPPLWRHNHWVPLEHTNSPGLCKHLTGKSRLGQKGLGCKPWELERGHWKSSRQSVYFYFLFFFIFSVKSVNLPVPQASARITYTAGSLPGLSPSPLALIYLSSSHPIPLRSSGTWQGSTGVSTASHMQGLGSREGWLLRP